MPEPIDPSMEVVQERCRDELSELAAHSYFTCVLNEQTVGLNEDFKCGIDIHFMLGALMPTCLAQTFKLIFPLADFFEFRTPWKLRNDGISMEYFAFRGHGYSG